MKLLRLIGGFLLGVGLFQGDAVQAQPSLKGVYFEAYGGLNLLPDVDVAVLGQGGGNELEFDPGVRLDLGGGYRFNQALSVGFEAGYLYNSVDKYSGAEVVGDLAYHQVPFLAVAKFQFKNTSPFTPYVSGGIGGVLGILSDEDESESSFAFAYQFGAGVTYELNQRMELGLGYKFLGVTDQSFYEDDAVEFDPTYNHSIGIQFSIKF